MIQLLFLVSVYCMVFTPQFTIDVRPISVSVCSDTNNLLLLLRNSTILMWDYKTQTHTKPMVVDKSVYFVICEQKSKVRLIDSTDKEFPNRLQWFAWGRDRGTVLNRLFPMDFFYAYEHQLFKNHVLISEYKQSIRGCTISWYHYPKHNCSTNPYKTMAYISGIHNYGLNPLEIYSNHEQKIAMAMFSNSSVDTNIPYTATEIRLYSNALGKLYCTYRDGDIYYVTVLTS